MNYVSVIKTSSQKDFEGKLNEDLTINKKLKLIDIKYSAINRDSTTIYTAIIIYQK